MSNLHIPPAPISAQAMADLLCTVTVVCRGVQTNGAPFWAYMAIKPSMAEAFKQAREKGGFNLDEFGTILEWGEGEQIPVEVEARMIRDHGIDPDYENKLIQALEEKRKGNA